MLIRKTTGFSLAALLVAAPILGIFAALPRSASAEALSPVTLTTQNATLFLPDSFEQYLALENPSSFDISEEYIAVADGSTLYIYDRAKGVYSQYEHTNYSQSAMSANVSKVQIAELEGADNDRIFFSDDGLHLYEYSFDEDATPQNMIINNVNAQSFLVDEAHGALFTANSATGNGNVELKRYSLDNFVTSTATCYVENASSPMLAENGDTLYLIYDNTTVCPFSVDNLTAGERFLLSSDASGGAGLQSVVCYGDDLYYAVKLAAENGRNGLYRYGEGRLDLGAGTAAGISALTVYRDSLYCVMGHSVYLLDVDEEKNVTFGDFEIAAGSPSVNRLNGATESVRAGNLLVTADKENDRISVYNAETDSYQVIPCVGVTHVATGGETIAAAAGKNITVYETSWNSEGVFNVTHTFSTLDYDVSGIVCVFGVYYFVTAGFQYGTISRAADGEDWVRSELAVRGTGGSEASISPKALAADLFGDIFLADQTGNVYRTDEETFTRSDLPLGSPVMNIGADFSSLRAGFDGTLYYLDAEKNLCMHDGTQSRQLAKIDGKDFVYTDDASAVSFALGYEDDRVYFCFGDFLVCSNEGTLGIATPWQLSDAADIVQAGDLLVVADGGNNRVTVYDMQKHSFAIIPTDFSPTLVATDGSVIAAASGNKVYVCKDPSKDQTFDEPVTADIGTIKGLACVNGNVYYITEYGYGKVEEEDFGLVSRLEDPLVALAADDNGILYVVDSKGYVRYYHEDEFINTSIASGGDMKLSLNLPISSLRADSKGNLYYIHENEIWKNDTLFFKIDNDSFVYGDKNELISFALGFEDDEVFLLYGNHIIKLNIPILDEIDPFVSHGEMLPPHEKGRRYHL